MKQTKWCIFIFPFQTFLGVIFENENSSEGIVKVLQDLQQYQPAYGDGEERVYGTQGIQADQLSVERANNALIQLSNGFTPEERFDGIHLEIADFHTAIKFLHVCITVS